MAAYKKIFIVDDDIMFTTIAKHLIQELKFAENIIDFPDGEDAFEFFKHNDSKDYPEIVLLDINMKRMDGWEFLNALKSLDVPKRVKIFMVSSSINPADLKKAKANSHVSSFISKPLNSEKLNKFLGKDKK